MAKKIAIITWDAQTVRFYEKQIHTFFSGCAEIETYNVQDGSASRIRKADLYLVSTCAYGEYEDVYHYLPLGGEIVIIQVTITRESLHRLLAVKRGSRALLVNISQRMVTETMAFFNQIGVNNIEFEPYYPGAPIPADVRLAVTPGEGRYVPAGVTDILDIGPRILSVGTIIEVALKLRCDSVLEQEAFRDYTGVVVDNNYSFQCLFHRSAQLESLFEILQETLDVGIIGVDAEGVVFAFNKKAAYVTGLDREDVIGRRAEEVLPGIPFAVCFESRCEIPPRLVKMHNTHINLTVSPVVRRSNLIGAFATVQKFTDEEYKQHTLRVQLLNKGHTTKYGFADIIGQSPAIRRACELAAKMAASSASVLITGESGTGKELFAHAIHAASSRRDYPFVAINCASIPDSLLESELFGYEEGAFTGAKRGGKPGYFEFAHRGTLFLDEIEGMSQLLQLKLLRVIQEKEVLRVGGNKVISVDVRIIAATNENLRGMVRDGTFRKDLYYRLGVLPVELPPLRQRGNDVLLLFEHLKKQIGATFSLSASAREVLLGHNWEGNVRELRNCVEYLAYLDKALVEPQDMPPGISPSYKPQELSQPVYAPPLEQSGVFADPFAQTLSESGKSVLRQLEAGATDIKTCRFLLGELASLNKARRPSGRKSLADAACAAGFFLGEQEVRALLARMEVLGLVRVHMGRGGAKITPLGEELALR